MLHKKENHFPVENLAGQMRSALSAEKRQVSRDRHSMLWRFRKYYEDAYRDGIIGSSRYRHYVALCRKMSRFLTLCGTEDMLTEDCSDEVLMLLRHFLFDEYRFVGSAPSLYAGLNPREIPLRRRNRNTVASEMKMLGAFFTELEDRDEIQKSPFRKMGTERRKAAMQMQYDEPYSLNEEEFERLLNTDLPEDLLPTRAAFVLQCFLGCRIGDFRRLSMENVAVSSEGIPYVHYLPQKMVKVSSNREEIKTPLVKCAYDIVQQTGFDLPVVRYCSGSSGYNCKIRRLLAEAGINRLVSIYDSTLQQMVYRPLCEVAGSKLCRKTFVDRMVKVQVNLYASGLHKAGSKAVEHYTRMELQDRFKLMCVAFGQQEYRIHP